MTSQPILCDIQAGVATVTLNNPPLNLVTLELRWQLNEVLDRLAADPEARVLILTGTGERAFCAGSDISEIRSLIRDKAMVTTKLKPENDTYSKVADFPKPTIAALNGLAFGGGLELAVCCDLIVAEEGVRLGLPEIKLGWFPGSGGTVRVTRRIGESHAKEMMFFGEPIEAATALAWGLVNRVAPTGEGLRVAGEMAAILAERPNRALQLCKSAIDLSFDVSEDQAVSHALALSGQVFSLEDCKEGARAFFAKEPPRFTHA
jgi:enoyl-CoA hydratase